MNWYGVKDGDARAYALMSRHYSFRSYADGRRQNVSNPNRHLFVGPGEKIVLMTNTCDALFVWRRFFDSNGDKVVQCAVFRNEGVLRSSDLIREAEEIARTRWPDETFYTFVDPMKVNSSNPGYCFLMAGWMRDKTYTGHLLRFYKRP